MMRAATANCRCQTFDATVVAAAFVAASPTAAAAPQGIVHTNQVIALRRVAVAGSSRSDTSLMCVVARSSRLMCATLPSCIAEHVHPRQRRRPVATASGLDPSYVCAKSAVGLDEGSSRSEFCRAAPRSEERASLDGRGARITPQCSALRPVARRL